MKKLALLNIFVILYTISLSSCSQLSHQSSNNENIRAPAAKELHCREIIKDLISPKPLKSSPSNVEKVITFSDATEESSLVKIINMRKVLKEKYHKISESIKDFDVTPDTPIKGKTKLLLDPKEGYLAKILMIRNAKETIDLSYYIFKSEDTGNALLHEVRMAIKRGVKVRILVDSSGSISKAPFYDDIKALVSLSGRPILDEVGNPTGEYAKAEAVIFNPIFNIKAHVDNWYKRIHNLFATENNQLPLATFTINRRSHDKILLVDANSEENSMAIIGGRNIADRYYAVDPNEKNPILDAEIIIKGLVNRNEDGSLQNALQDHYNKIYYYLANKNFENFLIKTNRETIRKEFKDLRKSSKRLLGENEQFRALLEKMEDEKFLETDFEDGLISIMNEIQNLSRTKIFLAPNGAHNKRNGNSIVSKMRQQIESAEKTIDIVSPYFWLPEEELNELIEWASKNPHRKIRFFSNSLSTTDNIVAQAMVDRTFKDMLEKRLRGSPVENQIEIYSYGKADSHSLDGNKKYGFLHAKIVVIDGKKYKVSTSNFDPISRHLNSEVGTFVDNLTENSKNAKLVNNFIEELKSNSTMYGSDEWKEVRQHPKLKILLVLESFITKIIYSLNLVPLI